MQRALPLDRAGAAAEEALSGASRPCIPGDGEVIETPPETATSALDDGALRLGVTWPRGASITPVSHIARPGSSKRRAGVRSVARSVRSGSCTRASVPNVRLTRCAATSHRWDPTCSSLTICSSTPPRSLELAQELRRRGIRKEWVSSRAASISSRAMPSCSRHGVRSARIRHFFRPRGGDQRGLKGLVKDATVAQTAEGIDVARAARIRRHRQLRDRSGAGARRTSAACGSSSKVSNSARRGSRFSRRSRVLNTSNRCAAQSAVPPVGALRHAPSPLGARARAQAVLRALL